MLEVINTLMFIIIGTITSTYINVKLSNKKIDFKKIKTWIILSIITLVVFILWKYNYGVSKTLFIFGMWIICYKYLLKYSLNEAIIINFIGIILNAISEIIFVILLIVILRLPEQFISTYITGSSIFCLLTFIIIVILIKLLYKYIMKLIEVLTNEKITYIFYIISILGITIFLSRNIIDLNDYKLISINIMTIILFLFIIILLFKEKLKTDKIKKEYDSMFEYLQNTETLLEKYQKYNHENKNQLVVLKSIASKNKKVVEFVDSILEDEIDHKDRWINELKNIPNGGLKGLLSYKINEMTDNKIKVTINASPRIKNFNFNKVSTKMYKDICRIIGVYIDNAYEASKESEKKEVSIEMIIEKEILVIIISNTFKGKIDLKSIDKYGYTTKGIGHGVGLSLVNDIIKSNKNLEQKRQIIKDYYFQYLYIKQ